MDKMEQQASGGHISLGVALFMQIVSRINDVIPIIKDVSAVLSLVAIILSIRYYWVSTKNKK